MGAHLYINRSAIKQISEPLQAGEWAANCEGMGVQSRQTVSSSSVARAQEFQQCHGWLLNRMRNCWINV